MDRDAKMRGLERMKRLRIPEQFRDYRVMLVELPGHADYDVIYDMPKRTVWVNAAARPGANIAAIEPEKT